MLAITCGLSDGADLAWWQPWRTAATQRPWLPWAIAVQVCPLHTPLCCTTDKLAGQADLYSLTVLASLFLAPHTAVGGSIRLASPHVCAALSFSLECTAHSCKVSCLNLLKCFAVLTRMRVLQMLGLDA